MVLWLIDIAVCHYYLSCIQIKDNLNMCSYMSVDIFIWDGFNIYSVIQWDYFLSFQLGCFGQVLCELEFWLLLIITPCLWTESIFLMVLLKIWECWIYFSSLIIRISVGGFTYYLIFCLSLSLCGLSCVNLIDLYCLRKQLVAIFEYTSDKFCRIYFWKKDIYIF